MTSPDRGRPLHDLNYMDRMKLCEILDSSNKWKELGKQMQFQESDLERIGREENRKSPAETLLKMWEPYSHTILELFVLLKRLAFYDAMVVLKSYVETRFWCHIKEQNKEPPVRRKPIQDTNLPSSNFDRTTEENVLETKGNNLILYSDENNVSHTVIEASKPNDRNSNTSNNNMSLAEKQETAEDKFKMTVAGTLFIPFEQLASATNNWNIKNILGEGGFGTVFLGTWQATKVAIKKIKGEARESQMKQLITELHCSMYRHDNILTLYGFSVLENQCCCLVYQFMPGGSLDHRIKSRDPNKFLSWKARIKMAIGIARGLQYLHNAAFNPLIHGDIKSANILLDAVDEPRIGDFGLVREGPPRDQTHKTLTKLLGTQCYLPDDFLRSRHLTVKVDTFCFGVVLFELATGRPAVAKINSNNETRTTYLKYQIPRYPEGAIMELKDGRVSGGEREYLSLINIGKACARPFSSERPLMMEVLSMLEDVGV